MTSLALLILLGVVGDRAVPEGAEKSQLIEVHARRFAYEPNIIRVQQGQSVQLRLISEDVRHGLYLDGYALRTQASPGQEGTLKFVADRTGRFPFRCSVTCGEFHPYMIGYLVVEPNWTFYGGLSLVGLLGLGSLVTVFRGGGPPQDKLFGLIPLGWRFELTRFRPIRALFKSRWFPLVPVLVNLFIFTIIIMAALVGGFGAGNYNFGIMIVWILWWVLLMMFMVPVIGRLWCMVCPFPLFGDWLQRGKLVDVGRQKSWGLNKRLPNWMRNLWPLVLLFWVATWFSGFFTVRPMATFILLGVVIVAAVVVSLIYGKRAFCLSFCPVSGFQGLYANFSACEVRVKDPEICKKHTPKTCVVGNDQGYGCPWMELPFDLNRNTYCGLCLECFKTCPHDNMAFNVRPFGADLLAERKRTDDLYHRRSTDEAFKGLTMIGIMFAFFLAMQGPSGQIKDMVRGKTLGGYLAFIGEAGVTDFLVIPGLFLLAAAVSRLVSGAGGVRLKDVFVNFSYCLVPVGLAIWAAFSLGIIFPNGSYLLHILSDPFAWGWDLFGTAHIPWTPVLTGAVPYLQAAVVLLGMAFALDYGFKFARITYPTLQQARRGWVPICLFLVALHMFFIWLFVA